MAPHARQPWRCGVAPWARQAGSISSDTLQAQVHLLEAFEVGAQLVRLGLARRHLLAQADQLLAGGHDGGHGVAALEHARRLGVVGIAREELVVERERLAEPQLVGRAVRAYEQHGGRTERPPRPRGAAAERGREQHDDQRVSERPHGSCGRRTVNRLPLPSCDSTVTRPPCASTTPRTTARPRPVPPRSLCAWRHESKMRGKAAAGMPTPVSSTWTSISGPASTSRTVTRPPRSVKRTALATRLTTTCTSRSSSPRTSKRSPTRSRVSVSPPSSACGRSSSTARPTTLARSTRSRASGSTPARSRDSSSIWLTSRSS